MNTNLKEVKSTAKMLFMAVKIEPNKDFGFIVCHPFTNTTVAMVEVNGKPEMVDITVKENYEKWKNFIFDVIDRCDKVIKIYMMFGQSWRLTFLKYAKDYINDKTFTELFADAWVQSENPNMDNNVTLKELISWFKRAKKDVLMETDDYAVWEALPDEFTVYRGVSVGRKEHGLSWTRNYDKAEWFANRFGEGYVLKATIRKENALAYLNTRNEDEIVVDVFAIKDKIRRM